MDTSEQSIEGFWHWVRCNRTRLEIATRQPGPVVDDLHKRLRSIHPGLRVEVGSDLNGAYELVISAEGDSTLFPLVDAIIDRSPTLPAWRFQALKPARGWEFTIDFEGVELSPSDIWIRLHDIPSASTEVTVHPTCRAAIPEAHLLETIALIIETGLGERLAAEIIQNMEIVDTRDDPSAQGFVKLLTLAEF